MIGCGGAGKSTLARRLGELTGLPVVHLDALYWRPGWVPTPDDEWRALQAEVVAREHGNIHKSMGLNASAMLRLLERCDAFRKPQRMDDILLACECDARGRLGLQDQPYDQCIRIKMALELAQSVNTASISAAALTKGLKGEAIGSAIAQARMEALVQGGF